MDNNGVICWELARHSLVLFARAMHTYTTLRFNAQTQTNTHIKPLSRAHTHARTHANPPVLPESERLHFLLPCCISGISPSKPMSLPSSVTSRLKVEIIAVGVENEINLLRELFFRCLKALNKTNRFHSSNELRNHAHGEHFLLKAFFCELHSCAFFMSSPDELIDFLRGFESLKISRYKQSI